jgi:hypothetical protein
MFFMDIQTTYALAPWVMPAMMFMSMASQMGMQMMAQKSMAVPAPPAPPTPATSADADKTKERLRAMQAESALTQKARVVAKRETADQTSKLGLTSSGSASAGTDKRKTLSLGS